MGHKQTEGRRVRARTTRPGLTAPGAHQWSRISAESRSRASERTQLEAIDAKTPIGRNAKALPWWGLVSQRPGESSDPGMTHNEFHSTKQVQYEARLLPPWVCARAASGEVRLTRDRVCELRWIHKLIY